MVGSPRPRLPSPHRPHGFSAWALDPTPPYLPRTGGGVMTHRPVAPAGRPTAGGASSHPLQFAVNTGESGLAPRPRTRVAGAARVAEVAAHRPFTAPRPARRARRGRRH